MTGFPTPYWYQEKAIADVRRAFAARHKGVCFVLPTGGGKTFIAAYIAHHARDKGSRVLFVAHRVELIEQISAALSDFGIEHGVIARGYKETRDSVQVAMVLTLQNRIKKTPDRYYFDLTVIDEAHHATEGTAWGAVAEHTRGRLLGLTATPCRLDGKGLGRGYGGYFDAIVEGPDCLTLIDEGKLSPFKCFVPKDAQIDTRGIKITGGDYNKRDLAERVEKSKIIGDVVKNYRARLDGAPSLAFTVSIDHAEIIADRFRNAGYRAAALSGKTPSRERAQMIADLGRGQINVLASCDVVSEGTDVPIVTGALMLRPTASLVKWLQQVGRVLRVAPGKTEAIIIDHVGNSLKPDFGFPTDPREWDLKGKPKRQGEVTIKQCSECYCMVSVFDTVCPECGHVFGADDEQGEGQGTREIDEVEGTLDEIDPVAEARHKRERIAAARTRAELHAVARELGYKPGWVHYEWTRRLKARQGKFNFGV